MRSCKTSRLIFRNFVFIKYKAFILSLCVLVYLSELVAMPISMEIGAVPMPTANTPAAQSSICAKQDGMDMACCKQTGKTHDHCPKPAKGRATNPDCCANCPFCYSTVIVSPGRLSHPLPITKRSFSIFTATYSYLYYSSAWKPPNRA
ncbi:MAG TPA: hypothetical protein VK518_09050 [Puia sp.]|nr:hypothetical protein [Puia sp.]